MDTRLRQSMNEYYDERAAEFDEIYTLGKPPGSVKDPEHYMEEARQLAKIVREQGRGSLLDIPCGTGYWLQFYAENCSAITLVDQSEKMLGQGREKAREHGVEPISRFLRADALEVPLEDRSFDTVLVGFFLSHITDQQMDLFFEKIRSVLKPAGHLLILDSCWSPFRKTRPKEGMAQRKLNDGRLFEIYKRYFDRSDFERMAKAYDMEFTIHHEGEIYLGVSGKMRD